MHNASRVGRESSERVRCAEPPQSRSTRPPHMRETPSNHAFMTTSKSRTRETDDADAFAEEVELETMMPTATATDHARDTDTDSPNAPLISSSDDAYVAPVATQQTDTGNTFVWALTIAACVSGLLFGYDTGVISSTLVSIGTDLSSRELTTLDKGLITSCTSLFALIASPVAGVLADRVGRKNIILFADTLFIIGALWQAATSQVWGMILGRSIVGLAIGGASLIVPIYIAELAPGNMRGRLVTMSLLFITGGQVVAYIVGWAFSNMIGGWRWMVRDAHSPRAWLC